MKKTIFILLIWFGSVFWYQVSASRDDTSCRSLEEEIYDSYQEVRDIATDFKPSTYNDPLKLIESQAVKSWNQSDTDPSDLDNVINTISQQVNTLAISDLDKQFYTPYISHLLQYHVRSQSCIPAKTYTAYKKLYDKIISNLKKYWRNGLSNSQKVIKLEMINDKLSLIDKYSWYKYSPIISYLHKEINKYILYILRLQS